MIFQMIKRMFSKQTFRDIESTEKRVDEILAPMAKKRKEISKNAYAISKLVESTVIYKIAKSTSTL